MKKSFRQYNTIIDNHFVNGYDSLFYKYLNENHQLNESFDFQDIKKASQLYDNFLEEAPFKYRSQYNLYNNLFEFLKTVNPESFIKRLKSISSDIIAIYQDIHVYVIIYCNTLHASEEIEKQLDIISNAYCYYEDGRTIEKDTNGNDYLQISYAIINTDNVTDIVYNDYNGIIWHICPKYIYENYVCKQGLLLKCGNKHKRQYLPRLYFFLDPAIVSEANIKKYAKSLAKAIPNENKIINTEYVLLKINLNLITNHNYTFYDDMEYGPNISVYTYETIHPKCIQFIKEFNI